MSKPTVTEAMTCRRPAVIWQPYTDGSGPGEPALLIHADANGLLVINQEGREVLIQRETVPALIKQLQRLALKEPE